MNAAVFDLLTDLSFSHHPQPTARCVGDLVVQVLPVAPEQPNQDIFQIFEADHELAAIPVVADGRPVGLINRNAFMQSMARPFFRELYFRKGCRVLMDAEPLVVEASASVQDLSTAVLMSGGKALQDGFIIVDAAGQYLGAGTGLDMVQALSDLQAEKNRLVMESIDYASVIQKSLGRHSRQTLRETLPDHFLLWEPRDVVAGDYFHFQRFEGGFFGALFDCTGHGVPGAFMTMIMSSFLQNALNEHSWRSPGAVMQAVNRRVKTALGQIDHSHASDDDVEDHASDDGMDAAFFCFDEQSRQLVFAGAHMPMLWLAPDGDELTIIDGNRDGVGYATTSMQARWDDHEVTLPVGAQVYFYTDGIVDQLGGRKRLAFGKRRLQQVILDHRHLTMPEQRLAIHEALQAWQGAEARKDDVSAMGFRI